MPFVRTLTPTIGAEVLGVVLAALTAADEVLIQQVFADHLVLFFRDQHLDDKAQRAAIG
jgi:alpha-ketoglutarate-dependent taurine dioxygenase